MLVFIVFCAIDTERGDEVFHMPVSPRTLTCSFGSLVKLNLTLALPHLDWRRPWLPWLSAWL